MNANDKPNFMRLAWEACKRSAPELLPYIFGFSALLMICNFYIMHDEMQMAESMLSSFQSLSDINKLQSLASDYAEPPVVHVAQICSNMISFIGFYYFTVLYLRREPLHATTSRPELNLTSFGKWLLQILKAALGVVGAALVAAAAGFALGFFVQSVAPSAMDIVTIIISVGVMLVAIFAAVKFSLVSPLTLSDVDLPVKTSWQMSTGHWWRLLWGYVCIGTSVFFVFLVAFLLLVILMVLVTSPQSAFFIGGLSLLLALFTTVNLAIGCVYFCVACRVLMQEQRLPGTSESGSIVKT